MFIDHRHHSFLLAHSRATEQQAQIQQQQTRNAEQQRQITQQQAGIAKLNARLRAIEKTLRKKPSSTKRR